MSMTWEAFQSAHGSKPIPEQFDLYQDLYNSAATWADISIHHKALWLDNYATAPTSAKVH